MTDKPVERVVVLSDDDIQRLLRGGRADDAMKAKLRKALEQPQGEVRTEYRVVADFASEEASITLLRPDELSGAEGALRAAAMYREGGVYVNPRAQQHTVFETEWTDIDQQEGDE